MVQGEPTAEPQGLTEEGQAEEVDALKDVENKTTDQVYADNAKKAFIEGKINSFTLGADGLYLNTNGVRVVNGFKDNGNLDVFEASKVELTKEEKKELRQIEADRELGDEGTGGRKKELAKKIFQRSILEQSQGLTEEGQAQEVKSSIERENRDLKNDLSNSKKNLEDATSEEDRSYYEKEVNRREQELELFNSNPIEYAKLKLEYFSDKNEKGELRYPSSYSLYKGMYDALTAEQTTESKAKEVAPLTLEEELQLLAKEQAKAPKAEIEKRRQEELELDPKKAAEDFKENYNNGKLTKGDFGGGRNLGVFDYKGKIIKVVKKKRTISPDQIQSMKDRLGDMDNVYFSEESIDLGDNKAAIVMSKAKGIDASNLTKEDIDNIPQEHWDKFEQDVRELSKRGVQIDLTKRDNLFYDKSNGFQFIDINGISMDESSTDKFFFSANKKQLFFFLAINNESTTDKLN